MDEGCHGTQLTGRCQALLLCVVCRRLGVLIVGHLIPGTPGSTPASLMGASPLCTFETLSGYLPVQTFSIKLLLAVGLCKQPVLAHSWRLAGASGNR